MQKRVSVITKVMLILLCMMAVITVTITVALIRQSSFSLDTYQQDLQAQNKSQYELLEKVSLDKLLLWVESFNHLVLQNDTIEHTLRLRPEDIDSFLNINLQIDEMWMFDETNRLQFGESTSLPLGYNNWLSRTRQSLRPTEALYCDTVCSHIMLTPIMQGIDKISVVMLRGPIQSLLAMLTQATGASRITLVTYDENSVGKFAIQSRLSESNRAGFASIFAALPNNVSVAQLVNNGVRVKVDNETYSVGLLEHGGLANERYYIMLVHDISSIISATHAYERKVIGSATGLFIAFLAIVFMFLDKFRKKLLSLSARLPLLAERRYDDFRASLKLNDQDKVKFPDELDGLQAVSNQLADQLESLHNRSVEDNAKLEKMAMYDTLTGLPNRNMLNYQIKNALKMLERRPSLVAVLFLDIDDFKKVNDSYGHEIGDKLLKAAADRIQVPIRDTDIAGRFGGDEFVILLQSLGSIEQVDIVCSKILAAFADPIKVGEFNFYVSASIGVATTTDSNMPPSELLRNADLAMYDAKAQKNSAYRVFDDRMSDLARLKVELENEAREALTNDDFFLALQPQVELQSRRLVGFEALIRWISPTRGFVSPGDFIPILEATPFMQQLDYWVIIRALKILKKMNDLNLPKVKVAVNLSSIHFQDATLPVFVEQQLLKYKIAPSQLELEVTETAFVSDLERATSVIEKIRSMGVLIAIDDFGTGYSSLSYLKSLPADYIKIDQSFISGITRDISDRSIVQSTIEMVKNLGLTVIAEGIETPEQYQLLQQFRCHQGQGYLISRPIAEHDLWAELEQKCKDLVWQIDIPLVPANGQKGPAILRSLK